jgi:2-deoxy-D-gluconate 3-dehydrogenase
VGSQIDYRLDGRSGIITGAANGIGRTLAVGLAEAGADIIVADLPVQRANAEETAEAVRRCGRKAMVVDMDVTDVSSIEAAVSSAVAEFGRVDFLVNNAGVNIRKPILEYTEDEWDKLSSVNLKGVFFCSQIVAKQMISQGGGRIVNIASQLATVAMRDRSIYAITKAGVAHMAKAFALELACDGVKVNAVAPTFVSTPLTTSMFTDPEFIQENLPKIPCGRFGTPEDVLGAVQFLLSPAADLINGHLLLVDGGYTIS